MIIIVEDVDEVSGVGEGGATVIDLQCSVSVHTAV